MHFSTAAFFVTALVSSVYTADFCHNKRPGIYCTSKVAYITCPGGGGLACPPHRDEKYIYEGFCVSNSAYDHRGRCRYRRRPVAKPSGPCAGKQAGKYCLGDGILTCPQGTGLDCGYRADQYFEYIGKCKSNGPNDNKATCYETKKARK